MDIQKNLTETNFNFRGTIPRWIVIHNTANRTSAEGTAYNNTQYFKNRFVSGAPEASAHYFIDDGDTVWQCVRDTDTAWHVGEAASRNGCYNTNSIGIEVCETADGWFTDKEVDTLRELVGSLMQLYGIPAERVCRHHDVTGKNCPWYYTDDERWAELKARILEDDMRPADVWEYNYEGSAPGGNMYNCVLGISDRLGQLSAKVDALAEKVADMSVGGVDVSEIAKAVNDDAAARMQK